MRTYALTYPQLMNQGLTQGLGDTELRQLQRAHQLAEAMADGLYRAQGVPFLNHLVRTASIALADDHPLHVVHAALLHAAGLLHRFDGSRRSRPNHLQRAHIRDIVGSDAEALLFDVYARLPWGQPSDRAAHCDRLADYDQDTRHAVAIRLANELEDFLDGAMAYGGPRRPAVAIAERGEQCVMLAEGLGLVPLARDLGEVFERHAALVVEPDLRSGHRIAYERERSHLWEQAEPVDGVSVNEHDSAGRSTRDGARPA